MHADITCDVAILGGGLAGGLIALALAERRPELTVVVVEAGSRLGGNHIWSFFDSDLDAAGHALVAPLVDRRWPAYDVIFPAHRRTIATGYASIRSDRFDAVLRNALAPERLLTDATVVAVQPDAVVLADQRRILAGGIIDARGGAPGPAIRMGWQKFVGLMLDLDAPHGLDRPIVMDAAVPQHDGYRFVYALPFGPQRIFLEDTYYSDDPAIDATLLEARIHAYAAQHGWSVAGVASRESGCLPVVLSGSFEALWAEGEAGVGRAGARAGLFQPTTSYSLPDAVRTALFVAGLPRVEGPSLEAALRRHAAAAWRERGFYRLLDRMLFHAARPEERYRVLERFYRLDPGLIGRFYAARSTWLDKARILAGKPPVPIGRAIRAAWRT